MRLAALALLALAPAAWAQAPGPDRGDGPPGGRKRYADPSAALAADIALSRLAQQRGQWWALRKQADPEAQLFLPQRTEAVAWLKKQRAEPSPVPRWQPQAVWASCNGEVAVTTGVWQQDAKSGSYATVWRRQQKGGGYGWLLTMRFASQPHEPPEMIPALVADCEGARIGANAESALAAGDYSETQVSRDGSLRWTSTVRADGARSFTLDMRRGGKAEQVLDLASASAP